MAPSRGKGKARATVSAASIPSSSRRSTRRTKAAVPDVYNDLLAEAAATSPVAESSRPLKRRRILREVSIPSHEAEWNDRGKKPTTQPQVDGGDKARKSVNVAEAKGRSVQTVEASSDDEDDSDFGFEDVDLDRPAVTSKAPAEEDIIADVSISLDTQTTPNRSTQEARRKPASAAEKAHRLLVHKAHVLCLLGHCIYVNSWCNNEVVQRNLESLVTVKMKTYLNPKASDSQFVRNRSFMDGLQQACEAFGEQFTVTAPGMRRAQWAGESGSDGTQTDVEPMDRSDFIRAAKKLEGSQDTGNQLFCAMLRSMDVEARLVCSLQPLPFTSTTTKSSTPLKKIVKPTILAIASDTDPDKSEASADDPSIQSSQRIGKIPSVRRRLGQPSFASSPAPSPAPKAAKKKAIRTLSYPIYWVEAFNTAQQKWFAVDPVLTGTVNKPSKLEPHFSYELNQMSYVLAFESSGVAKDVTRRYAKAYNAKTRRQRVESTENGTLWWKKALRIFRRRGIQLDRDQVEDAELAQKEAREGLPANVQDFKEHPYYALERHLKRHEVLLLPRREVGLVNAGTAAKPRMEKVFRRSDVVGCRSGDRWFRLGREVKEGEQPLKRVVRRLSRRGKSPVAGDEEADEEATTTPLYAPFQTRIYVPPPVIQGRVPRNAYGNLDIYTPSMVPAGGVHIRHPLTQHAAKLLRIDYADAVTGFQFKGRQGTAVVEGAVVAEGFVEAVGAVIAGLEAEEREEAGRRRSLRALGLWGRWLKGLRIRERVGGYGDPKGRKDEDEGQRREEGGGYLPDEVAEDGEMGLVTAGLYSIGELSAPGKGKARKKRMVEESDEDEEYGGPAEDLAEEEMDHHDPLGRPDEDYTVDDDGGGGGFIADVDAHDDGGGGFVPDVDAHDDSREVGFLAADDDRGGGFVPEDGDEDDGGGGGFVPEAMDTGEASVDTESHAGLDHSVSGPVEHGDEEFYALHIHHNISAGRPVDTAEHLHPAVLKPHDDDENNMVDAEKRDGGSAPSAIAEVQVVGSSNDAAETIDDELSPVHEKSSPAHGLEATTRQKTANGLVRGDEETGVGVHDQMEGNESDEISLLSQDPEDEDAEPDWLESD